MYIIIGLLIILIVVVLYLYLKINDLDHSGVHFFKEMEKLKNKVDNLEDELIKLKIINK